MFHRLAILLSLLLISGLASETVFAAKRGNGKGETHNMPLPSAALPLGIAALYLAYKQRKRT